MKLTGWMMVGLLFASGMLSEANAQAPGNGSGGRPQGKGRQLSADELLKKFDKDGDGKLSKVELEAFVKQLKSRRPGGGEGQSGRGGGRLSRKEMLEKYDKDGDGELSPEERQAMFEDMKARRNRSGTE